MKERILNVLAWGVWIGVTGWLLFVIRLIVTGDLPIEQLRNLDTIGIISGTLLGPLVVQWVLFYIVTGSPRILPWRK
ncbi:hypothetical protein OAS73_05070 [Luminiphilus sp.]|nr:hypothetical protein [Luminiphilus sp.]